MRNMSFSHTKEQIKNGSKIQTIRKGWVVLKPGDRVMACEKCMGLKKGEKIVKIREIEVIRIEKISVSLKCINKDNVVAEGFPELHPVEFLRQILIDKCGLKLKQPVNRIYFRYV